MLKLIGLSGILSTCIALYGCGGGNDSNSRLDNFDGSQSALDGYDDSQSLLDIINGKDGGSNGGNGNGNRPSLGNIAYLNCAELDPEKVYLLGHLKDRQFSYPALIDLDDPSKFCVGFDAVVGRVYSIAKDGSLIHGDNNIYKMVPDQLTINTDLNEWVYPQSAYENDEQLVQGAFTQNIFAGNNDAIYYTSGNDMYVVGEPDIPYYESISGIQADTLLVTPNGGILASKGGSGLNRDDELVFVDSNLNITSLLFPEEGEYHFMSARMNGNGSAWVYVIDSDENHRRWSIDLSSLSVTDDGLFSALPQNLSIIDFGSYRGRSKLNRNGGLIQMVSDDTKEPGYQEAVVVRTLVSGTNSTSILHSNASYTGDFRWTREAIPFVHVQTQGGFGVLITGH